MRNGLSGAFSDARRSSFRPVDAGFQADGDPAPPAPSQMLARLGLLLVIALGFGLAAQLLVGAPT